MGQWTFGIMYGVRQSDVAAELYEEDTYERGLLNRWEIECRPLIEDHDANAHEWVMAKPGRRPYERMRGEERYVPRMEHDGRPNLLGFFVTVGASGRGGLPSMNDTAFAFSAKSLREDPRFALAYRNARRRWSRFARWATSQGVTLPRARLWITNTEVA